MKHYGTLHIFGQKDYHADAAIVGDRIGLEKLRNAIDNALTEHPVDKPICASYTNDGEGYIVTILCREKMARVPLPFDGYYSAWPKWLQRIVG